MEPLRESRSCTSLQRSPLAEPRLPPRNPRAPLFLALALLLPLAACGGTAAAGTLAARTDSAGVTIVTNTDASWRGGDGWQIDATPRLEIGPTDTDDPRYDFLRITGGTVLPTGEIAVLVSGSRDVRVFSADGVWLRTFGRDGEGPGEMRFPSGMTRAGDTLLVTDPQLGRLTAFGVDGQYRAAWTFPTLDGSGRVQPEYRLADGTWISSGAQISFGSSGAPRDGLNRPPVRFFRVSSDLATVLDTLGETSGSEMVLTTSGRSATGQPTMIMFMPPPLGRSAPYGATGSHFVWGDNASPEVRFHAPDGALEIILRWSPPAIPVDAALLEQLKQAALTRATTEQARERIEGQYAAGSPAPVVPYFSRLLADPEGHLWVQAFAPFQTDSVRFHIFDAEGQYLGSRSLPPRHRVLEIGTNHILTVWQDDDDLEYLRVFGITK